MLSFFKLIKIENLLFIILAQLCLRYGLLNSLDIDLLLSDLGILLLIIATFCIGAAGNIILETHATASAIIPSKIREKTANTLFIILSTIGVLIGFYLSNIIGKPGFVTIFILTSAIYYIYATYLKEILILKNITMAILVSVSILAIAIFDLVPTITPLNREAVSFIFSIVKDYAILAFLLTFVREIAKDCYSLDTDYNHGIKTIPIALGKSRTAKLIMALSLLISALLFYYTYTYLFANTKATLFVLLGLIAPLLIISFKSWTAETIKDFKLLSILIKIVMVIAAISFALYKTLIFQ